MILRSGIAILLSCLCIEAKDIGWDIGELKRRGLQEDRYAQLRLGLAYSSGIGVEMNPREAFYWFEKAAKQGDPVAAHYLARAYAKGTGTHRDRTQVIHWYREAALGSSVLARGKLVALLRAEDSGSAERTEACAWCVIGDEMGDESLKKTLELMMEQEEVATIAAGKAKAIELKEAIDQRTEKLRPTPRDPQRGTFLYPRGERYFGQVRAGKPHGYGLVDSPSGDRFYGEFRDGRANGYGVLFNKGGKVLFSGLWQNDKAVAGDGKQLPLAIVGDKN